MTDLELASYVRASGCFGLTAGETATVADRIEALAHDVRVLKADLERSEDNVSHRLAERDKARALLREARAAMAAVVTGDYPNPRDHRPGQCKHGTDYWVDCGQCIDEWLEAAVARIDALLAGKTATDIETERRIAAGLDPDGGFDGPTGAD